MKIFLGGSGHATRISFEHITLIEIEKPIIIDQFYSNDNGIGKEQAKLINLQSINSNYSFNFKGGTQLQVFFFYYFYFQEGKSSASE